MSNTPIQVTTDLSQVLERIDQKLEMLSDLRVDLAEVKTEIKGLKEDIKDIKGSQKAQIWALIGILGTAVVGTVIRFAIAAIPSKP